MATPIKLTVGVKVMFVPLMFAVPFVEPVLMIVRLPPGVRTTSLSNGLKVLVVFSVMLAVSGFASGGLFVTLVTTGGVRLFVGVGSTVGLPTLAVFVNNPRCVEMTVSVRLLAVFAAKFA